MAPSNLMDILSRNIRQFGNILHAELGRSRDRGSIWKQRAATIEADEQERRRHYICARTSNEQVSPIYLSGSPFAFYCVLGALRHQLRLIKSTINSTAWAKAKMDPTLQSTVILLPRGDNQSTTEISAVRRRPFDVEHVLTPREGAYDFRWDGSRDYLACHDMVFADGEISGDSFGAIRRLDIRRRLTFFPEGHQAHGWSAPSDRANSFAAIYFDKQWLFEQLETPSRDQSLAPSVYFQDQGLWDLMEKLGQIVRARQVAPKLILDSVVVLALSELLRVQGSSRKTFRGLSEDQARRAKDYIEAHLFEDVALSDIADAAGLSMHHFVRAFKVSEGVPPYRHVLVRRIERAKELIETAEAPIASIGQMVGFKSASHFSRTFADIVGASPRDYRKSLRS
jgi:AraC family transcriptional regulator